MKTNKNKILVFIDWYLPGFKAGGPIKSCASLVDRMNSYFHFRIITGNTDLNENSPYVNVKSNEWNTLENGTEVYYCSAKKLNYNHITNIIKTELPDVVYLNSMFSYYFTLLPLIALKQNNRKPKIVVAPRGMLSPGALSLKSGKKKIFLTAAKTMGLFKGVTFHASTAIEVDEIKATFGQETKIVQAINLTPKTEVVINPLNKEVNKIKLVYVGRISEVKNLIQCLNILKNITSGEIIFDVFGPHDDEGYYSRCTEAIKNLPANITVNLKGGADNETIRKLLPNYHFLFLLSMNENYGHAIVEGFTAGCPVIISNQTPWKNLSSRKCGWDLDLKDENKITGIINQIVAMGNDEYDEWSRSASAYAISIHENKQAIEDHLKLFETA